MKLSRQGLPIHPVLIVVVALLLSACTSSAGAIRSARPEPPDSATPPLPAASSLPIDQSVMQVSATEPGAEAQGVFDKCNIGDMVLLKRVTGMGKIPTAKDLLLYVPLTGREPQLEESGPAWVVTIRGDIPQPGSTEIWTDPTCVVTDNDFGYFATGTVIDTATGKVIEPEPPSRPPELRVPPLSP